MSAIDLYEVLKQVPNVTLEQAKQAADGVEQSDRLQTIERDIAELKITQRMQIALILAVLVLQLTPYFS